jgi:hypothetical protein
LDYLTTHKRERERESLLSFPVINFDQYKKLVKPILLYSCEIWGSGNNDILEKVYLKFCKIILHLKATTPNIWGAWSLSFRYRLLGQSGYTTEQWYG